MIKNLISNKSKQSKFKVGCIGLEFALEKIYLVQLKQSEHGNIRLQASAVFEYPNTRDEFLESSQDVKSIIKLAKKSEPFIGCKVVSNLPSNDVRLMSIAYQVENEGDEETALLKRVEDRLNDSLDGYVIDYLPVRGNIKSSDKLALVALARRDVVINYLELLRKAGLEVVALDISPSAIKRLIATLADQDQTDNVLTINFGRKKTYMILMSGRRLLLDMEIDFGETELLEKISNELDMDVNTIEKIVYEHGLYGSKVNSDGLILEVDEVADTLREILKPKFTKLADEINRSLIYTASETRGGTVKQVYLLGGLACWRGIDEMLNRMIDIPVTVPNYFTTIINDNVSKMQNYDIPIMGVATGLALRGMVDHV